MIVTRLIGGLGNQMFQYAVGRCLAEMHDTELRLDITAFENYTLHKYKMNVFNIQERFSSDDDVANVIFGKNGFLRKMIFRKNNQTQCQFCKGKAALPFRSKDSGKAGQHLSRWILAK